MVSSRRHEWLVGDCVPQSRMEWPTPVCILRIRSPCLHISNVQQLPCTVLRWRWCCGTAQVGPRASDTGFDVGCVLLVWSAGSPQHRAVGSG